MLILFCDSLYVYSQPHRVLIFNWIGLKYAPIIQETEGSFVTCIQLLNSCLH